MGLHLSSGSRPADVRGEPDGESAGSARPHTARPQPSAWHAVSPPTPGTLPAGDCQHVSLTSKLTKILTEKIYLRRYLFDADVLFVCLFSCLFFFFFLVGKILLKSSKKNSINIKQCLTFCIGLYNFQRTFAPTVRSARGRYFCKVGIGDVLSLS